VIFSSDNGPESSGTKKQKSSQDNSTGPGLGRYYSIGETAGLKGQKRSLYAGGVRVPFIVRWPGVVPGGKVDTHSVITAVDLLPAFMEIAGGQLPPSYQPDGESILAALKGQPFTRTKPIFWEWRGHHGSEYLWPHLGIRQGKWKLMINQEMQKTELYDIESDWAERSDLSDQFPNVTKRLTDKVLAWKTTLPKSPPRNCFSTHRVVSKSHSKPPKEELGARR
jgi:arylsulfatase A-like enzyme